MNSKVSSEAEESTLNETDSSNDNESDTFSVPCCSMCPSAENSVSYCSSCMHYLCRYCDYSHHFMKFFQSHRFVDISTAHSVGDLERILQSVEPSSDASSSEESSESYRKRKLENIFWHGTMNVNDLLCKSYELNLTLSNLRRYRLEAINFMQDIHSTFHRHLHSGVYHILTTLDREYNILYAALMMKKEKLDAVVKRNLIRLYDIRQSIDRGDGAASSTSSTSSTQEANGVSPFEFANNVHLGKELNFGSRTGMSGEEHEHDEPVPGTSKNDVDPPYDSCNISVVALEPNATNLTRNVNPDPFLTTTDPDSLPNANHVSTMQIHKIFGQKGNASGQFNSPHGFCLGLNEDIIVADTSNHRIQVFDKFGRFIFQFGLAGRQEGYLWYPRKIALLPRQKCYVICDRGYERSRMQIFTQQGKFIKKIFIQYIDIVAGISITPKEDIVVVNSVTPTVFIIGQNDFLRTIDCTGFMEEPSDIAVVGKEFYICDFKAHRVVVIDDDGTLLRTFGDKHIMMFPNGIDVSVSGYVVVCDSHGNYFHVVVYTTDGTFIAEFRCPYVKVSRCCCVKITQETRLVTADKNFHHVIMLDAPFLNNH